jgi:hypothetical protein
LHRNALPPILASSDEGDTRTRRLAYAKNSDALLEMDAYVDAVADVLGGYVNAEQWK